MCVMPFDSNISIDDATAVPLTNMSGVISVHSAK